MKNYGEEGCACGFAANADIFTPTTALIVLDGANGLERKNLKLISEREVYQAVFSLVELHYTKLFMHLA
ncbi:hypothetical protein NECAME_03105 [Necator americanus]|uniref:Uncharacterized protein n=1 Tax=Necator americanus TaxID=51031 RepID=W2T9L4_NECAM|nr:hypothetical protein NECAME_03105 [Necator americanus]ETN77687.1 hypothetical protein NECAME_03105 [Necator americanus]